jgi:hypothetical protein
MIPPMVMYARDVPGADEGTVVIGVCVLVVIGIGDTPAREETSAIRIAMTLKVDPLPDATHEGSQMVQLACQ